MIWDQVIPKIVVLTRETIERKLNKSREKYLQLMNFKSLQALSNKKRQREKLATQAMEIRWKI